MSYRRPKLANEHRQFYATRDQEWKGPLIQVRGRRAPTDWGVAPEHDPFYVPKQRSWKSYRKTQYKPG